MLYKFGFQSFHVRPTLELTRGFLSGPSYLYGESVVTPPIKKHVFCGIDR